MVISSEYVYLILPDWVSRSTVIYCGFKYHSSVICPFFLIFLAYALPHKRSEVIIVSLNSKLVISSFGVSYKQEYSGCCSADSFLPFLPFLYKCNGRLATVSARIFTHAYTAEVCIARSSSTRTPLFELPRKSTSTPRIKSCISLLGALRRSRLGASLLRPNNPICPPCFFK